jgi:acetyltransferase-like isoleucine patch superfamily enzyme
VVRDSVEPFSVVSGNPAGLIKKYNPKTQEWEKIPDLLDSPHETGAGD